MQQQFDPDSVRQEITRQLHAILTAPNDAELTVNRQQLVREIEAIGAWDTYQCEWYGFEMRKWLRKRWESAAFADAAAASKEATKLRQIQDTLTRLVTENRESHFESPRVAADVMGLLKDRMNAELFGHGCGYALEAIEKGPRVRREGPRKALHKDCELLAGKRKQMWAAYQEAAKENRGYDERMQLDLALLSTAPRDELRRMRSLFFGRRSLPWWLDGRLELIAFARTRPDIWESCDSSLRESLYPGRTVAGIVGRIGGKGHRVGQAASVLRDNRGVACKVYTWHMREGAGFGVELLAPLDSRIRCIHLRLRTSSGREPAESTWLTGRVMCLSGRMLHWTKTCRDGVVGVELETVGKPLPESGPLVLVDLFTQQVLEPVEGATYRDE
jgi:hypothetical protein